MTQKASTNVPTGQSGSNHLVSVNQVRAEPIAPPVKQSTVPNETAATKNETYTEQPESLPFGDVVAQEDMVFWAMWMFVAAAATFCVTSIGTLLIWRQVKLTRQAVEDTGEATKEIKRTNVIADDTAKRQLRAYVYESGFQVAVFKTKEAGLHHWTFRPDWVNAGQTPTRQLRMQHWRYLEDADMPADYTFDKIDPDTRSAILAPGKSRPGSAAGLLFEEAIAVAEGRSHFYLWGWARYRDTFESTPEHVTKFCYKVKVLGDLHSRDPDAIHFDFEIYSRHNCADEECSTI